MCCQLVDGIKLALFPHPRQIEMIHPFRPPCPLSSASPMMFAPFPRYRSYAPLPPPPKALVSGYTYRNNSPPPPLVQAFFEKFAGFRVYGHPSCTTLMQDLRTYTSSTIRCRPFPFPFIFLRVIRAVVGDSRHVKVSGHLCRHNNKFPPRWI